MPSPITIDGTVCISKLANFELEKTELNVKSPFGVIEVHVFCG